MNLKQCLGLFKLILLLYAVPRARLQKGIILSPAMYPEKLMLILQVQTPPRNTGPVLKHFFLRIFTGFCFVFSFCNALASVVESDI